MCRIPKVVIVAPDDVRSDLRRKISSIEYEIAAAVGSLDETTGITCDVVVLWEPDVAQIAAARERGLKTVGVAGAGGADMDLTPDDAGDFKSRVWELFRPA